MRQSFPVYLELRAGTQTMASAKLFEQRSDVQGRMILTIYVDDLSEFDELVAQQNVKALFANARAVTRGEE